MDRMRLWENVLCKNDSAHSCSPYVLSEHNKPMPLCYREVIFLQGDNKFFLCHAGGYNLLLFYNVGEKWIFPVDLGYSMLALYRRRLFETTEMLLKDIARAANIGWSCFKKSGATSSGAKIPAATGIRTML